MIQAFVSFFENFEALERRQPQHSKYFQHIPDAGSRPKSQEEIATILPARDEYIVTTSEFDLVKAPPQNRKQEQAHDKKTDADKLPCAQEQQQTQDKARNSRPNHHDDSDPDRPVLKKRTDDGQ